ncbi:SRPBCC family protein [Staphylococcus durrellii]|uniref:SRPBCC family protein n=1 Tax=Staphylococcus durrellii TaxID=2781773 RepID=UPI00189FC082|nr:SRPBCC domain-containing protein [Staphylococcus durrellii]MBF7016320.1 SRPBCC domain-containing protein [Staphylococcus durrellii]
MGLEVNNNKIIFTRVFKATTKAVYKAYTDKSLFAQWFHPKGATTEVFKFNVREGGKAFFAIHTPQGTSYTVTQYNKVTEPYYIDYNDFFANAKGEINKSMAGMHNIIQIEDEGEGYVKVIATSELPDAASAQRLIDMGVEQGMHSTFDNLEQLLSS